MIPVIVPRTDIEPNAKTALTELRGLLFGNTAEFGQFLIQKSKEWDIPAKRLLGQFEKLGEEFSDKKTPANKKLYVRVKKYLDNPTALDSSIISKKLKQEEAENLVFVIAKYINLDTVGEMTGNEFGYELFSKMNEDEIVYVSSLFVDNITKAEPSEIIELCIKGMIRINLLDLLKTHKSGLGK